MTWTEKDKILFNIVNQFGEKHLEYQIQDASEKYLTLKTSPSYFIIFGYYSLINNTFFWENRMNEHSYNAVKRNHMDVFGSESILKKLFRSQVIFDKENINIIPYLMEALNEGLNVVRFKNKDVYVYGLTKVQNTNRTFNPVLFEEALIFYRNEKEKETYKKKNQTLKNKKNVFECKEKLV